MEAFSQNKNMKISNFSSIDWKFETNKVKPKILATKIPKNTSSNSDKFAFNNAAGKKM